MLFSKNDIWLNVNDNIARIGISDYAQEKLGSIVFLNLPDVGEKIKINERFGDVESLKTISDLISPVDGVIIKVNEAVIDETEKLNQTPYESWLLEVRIENTEDELFDEEAYLKYRDENNV